MPANRNVAPNHPERLWVERCKSVVTFCYDENAEVPGVVLKTDGLGRFKAPAEWQEKLVDTG